MCRFREATPLTGDESRVAEVKDVDWPSILEPVDDLPPATMILSVTQRDGRWLAEGVSHDNGAIQEIRVNGKSAEVQARITREAERLALPHEMGDLFKVFQFGTYD